MNTKDKLKIAAWTVSIVWSVVTTLALLKMAATVQRYEHDAESAYRQLRECETRVDRCFCGSTDVFGLMQ